MRGPRALLFGLGFLALAGCRNCDLVEAELRSRENELRELRADLARTEAHNDALQREVGALRQGTAAKISPEFASQTYTLKQVTLGRQTGGYDDDGVPGDEALQLVLEPRDGDGQAIKAPGTLHAEALQINAEGLKTPLSAWDLTPDQLRRTWRSGLFGSGYYVILPWKAWPTTEKLRVVAQFTLADGRVFEADKDVTIHLTSPSHHKSPPAEAPGPTLPEAPVLPAPRKVDPKAVPDSKASLEPPVRGGPVDPAAHFQAKPVVPIYEAVELLRPAPLPFEPGQGPLP